jgi:hypothetical protein
MNRLLLITITVLLISCQSKRTETSEKEHDIQNGSEISKKSAKDFNYEDMFIIENFISNKNPKVEDITVIDENGVVFIFPDSVQIAQMKGKTNEDLESFYTVADDNSFYQNEALKLLDSLHVRTIHPKSRYLKFVMNEESILIDTKSKYSGGWMTILFNTNKKPKIVSAVGFESFYSEFVKE